MDSGISVAEPKSANDDRAGLPPMFALLLAATLVSIPFVFFTLFNHFSWFDDEGTLMVGFRSLIDGHRMYDEIYSLYGPLYNGVYGFIYKVLRVPLTHTAARSIAALLWLGFTAGFAMVSYRMTGSRIVALVCYVLTLFWLAELFNSPGHPQELCLLLTAFLLLAVHRIGKAPTPGSVALAGGLVAGLALLKINIGVFAAGPLLLVLLRLSVAGVWRSAAICVASAGLLAMPLALSSLLFDFDWVRSYAAFSCMTIGAALAAGVPGNPLPVQMRPAHWAALVCGGSLVGVVVIGGTILAGSSPHAILDAVVLQNAHFVRNWYLPLQFGRGGLVPAVISVSLAIITRLDTLRRRTSPAREKAILVAKCSFVLAGTLLFVSPYLMLLCLAPFCWLVLICPPESSTEIRLLRQFAGLLGAVLSFYPFPVAGGQVDIGTLVPVIALPVLAHDVWIALRARGLDLFQIGRARLLLAASAVLLFLVSATVQSGRTYAEGTPLDLPGTAMIRLPSQQVKTLRWVTSELATCKSSYSMPGLLSFAFWTGQPLLTPMNINDVLAFLRPDQQEEIVSALRAIPDLCIVYNDRLLRFLDRGQIASNPPLLRYIHDGFDPVAEQGGFVILRRHAAPGQSAPGH